MVSFSYIDFMGYSWDSVMSTCHAKKSVRSLSCNGICAQITTYKDRLIKLLLAFKSRGARSRLWSVTNLFLVVEIRVRASHSADNYWSYDQVKPLTVCYLKWLLTFHSRHCLAHKISYRLVLFGVHSPSVDLIELSVVVISYSTFELQTINTLAYIFLSFCMVTLDNWFQESSP